MSDCSSYLDCAYIPLACAAPSTLVERVQMTVPAARRFRNAIAALGGAAVSSPAVQAADELFGNFLPVKNGEWLGRRAYAPAPAPIPLRI